MFNKGRHRDVKRNLNYPAQITFFLDICFKKWQTMLSFWNPTTVERDKKTKWKSIPEKWRTNEGQDWQHVIISFEVLQNMRLRWSQNFMKHLTIIVLRSNQPLPKRDMKNSIDILNRKIKISSWSAQWSKRRSWVITTWCDLPSKSP